MRSGIRKYGGFLRELWDQASEKEKSVFSEGLLWVGRYPYYMPQQPYYGL